MTNLSVISNTFLDYLRLEDLMHISDKEELRTIYKNEFKQKYPMLKGSFSAVFYNMKFRKKIYFAKNEVKFRNVGGYHPLAVDQYTSLNNQRRHQYREQEQKHDGDEAQQQQQQQQQSQLQRWRCRVCGVRCNSDISFQEHIDSKRHRQQLILKVLKMDRDKLIANKNGVRICSDCDGDKGAIHLNVMKKERKSVDIKVTNY
uniref:Probable serine/threonine-protein kinase irlF-like n=1 Tax=Saccoglossus kowalevskii TaxID=10224 RepID=A0ABM0MRK0_SACKO